MSETLNSQKLSSFTAFHFSEPTKMVTVLPVNEDFTLTDEVKQQIVSICNQEAIYNFLFRKRLNGEPYQPSSAEGFITWAKQGWASGEYFVFISRDELGNIVGAIDIKSNKIVDPEIGYWMDKNAPGYMSNIVSGLVDRAKEAGAKTVIAYTKPENEKSKRVLLRAGFTYVGRVDHADTDGEIHDLFRA
jgi:RimJ/RimL family protein N-acetyltransferase